MNTLGDVLGLMTGVVVIGCLAWGATAALLAQHRMKRIDPELRPVDDDEWIAGVENLRRAVAAQRQADEARDMHRRHWR